MAPIYEYNIRLLYVPAIDPFALQALQNELGNIEMQSLSLCSLRLESTGIVSIEQCDYYRKWSTTTS